MGRHITAIVYNVDINENIFYLILACGHMCTLCDVDLDGIICE